MPKPSFLTSTLGLSFFIIIVAIIAMIFMKVEPSDNLLTILSSVVSFYIGQRKGQEDGRKETFNSKVPNEKKEDDNLILTV